MHKQHFTKTIIPPILGYLTIIWIFSRALIAPEDNISFIYDVGLFMFITEFISIHSAVMLTQPKKLGQKIFALSIYLIFIGIFSYGTKTPYPAILFTLSLFAKLFRGHKGSDAQLIAPALIFMASVCIIWILESFITWLIVFPPEVLVQKPANSSGAFVDHPQTLLVWGLLYYAGMIVFQLWQQVLQKPAKDRSPA